MRGEYNRLVAAQFLGLELPPRARRIHVPINSETELIGTTSACAENTGEKYWVIEELRNYLRVRGEYRQGHHGRYRYAELPPRARRILLLSLMFSAKVGTTSACAENTRS